MEDNDERNGSSAGIRGNKLLDLSKMLEDKKKQKELKRKKVEEIELKDKNALIYNPLLIKDSLSRKNKDIQIYKYKISQEKYF